jgi:hypothetical protein
LASWLDKSELGALSGLARVFSGLGKGISRAKAQITQRKDYLMSPTFAPLASWREKIRPLRPLRLGAIKAELGNRPEEYSAQRRKVRKEKIYYLFSETWRP